MEIVAIIPARIHTKRVPNKMLRIVGKHPLVYYAIKNAQDSGLITRIIVSTDSEKIAIIAKQMGVECIMRDASICEDDTPLDIVVYEAVKDMECDYVVTLQPTSPLLKKETLDKAITFCMDQNADSVISVINKPRLAWKRQDYELVPQYGERLNSQFLPAYYVETGAFFISRRSAVTKESRLGEKNELYEISAEEAISVCELQDLALVSMLINEKKAAFYVNGNSMRGMGHIYRVLELADEFYRKPDIYYDVGQTDPKSFGSTYYELIGIHGEEELIDRIGKGDYGILINDVLSTSEGYMDKLRERKPDLKIVNFEDDGPGARKADLVINALYQESEYSNALCGEAFYIVPKAFFFYEPIPIKDKVSKVLVTFGGADPSGYTLQVLQMIEKYPEDYKDYHFDVVVGRANTRAEEILSFQNRLPNVNILYDVENMPQVMSGCDVALTSRGRTGFELAVLGIPAISIAQNAQEETHDFMSEENGFFYLGCRPEGELIKKSMDDLLHSPPETRRLCQDKMMESDLRGGRDRVLHRIRGI